MNDKTIYLNNATYARDHNELEAYRASYKANMELFNSYARGGIEYLYEHLVLRVPDVDEDYTDFRISNIVALVNNQIETEVKTYHKRQDFIPATDK